MVIVDTLALAAALNVKPGTVASWATRGHITPAGRDRRGRTTYDLEPARRYYTSRARRPAPVTGRANPVQIAPETHRPDRLA